MGRLFSRPFYLGQKRPFNLAFLRKKLFLALYESLFCIFIFSLPPRKTKNLKNVKNKGYRRRLRLTRRIEWGKKTKATSFTEKEAAFWPNQQGDWLWLFYFLNLYTLLVKSGVKNES